MNTKECLRYDGLYRSVAEDPGCCYWQYLRFYPGGEVIEVSANGDPGEWFCRERADIYGISCGMVKMDGNRIHFSVASEQGVEDFDGVMDGGLLNLESYSHINGNRQSVRFEFVPQQRPAAA